MNEKIKDSKNVLFELEKNLDMSLNLLEAIFLKRFPKWFKTMSTQDQLRVIDFVTEIKFPEKK